MITKLIAAAAVAASLFAGAAQALLINTDAEPRRSSDEVKKPALSVVVLRRARYDAEVIRLQLVGIEKPPVSQLPHGVAPVAGCHHYPELGIVVLRRAGYGGEIVVVVLVGVHETAAALLADIEDRSHNLPDPDLRVIVLRRTGHH